MPRRGLNRLTLKQGEEWPISRRIVARPQRVSHKLASTAKVSDFLGLNCAKSRPNFYDAERPLLFRICDMRIGSACASADDCGKTLWLPILVLMPARAARRWIIR